MKNLVPGLIISTGEKVMEHCFSVRVNPQVSQAGVTGRESEGPGDKADHSAGGHLPRNSVLPTANVGLPLACCDVLPKPT